MHNLLSLKFGLFLSFFLIWFLPNSENNFSLWTTSRYLMSFGGYLMPGLAENSMFVSSCLFWCLFSMCIPYCWGLKHLYHCWCPRNEVLWCWYTQIKKAVMSGFLFLQVEAGCVGWISLEVAEKWEKMGKKTFAFQVWCQQLFCYPVWELTCCQALSSAAVSQGHWWAAWYCCFKEKTCWRCLVKWSSVSWNSRLRILCWNL